MSQEGSEKRRKRLFGWRAAGIATGGLIVAFVIYAAVVGGISQDRHVFGSAGPAKNGTVPASQIGLLAFGAGTTVPLVYDPALANSTAAKPVRLIGLLKYESTVERVVLEGQARYSLHPNQVVWATAAPGEAASVRFELQGEVKVILD